MHGLRISLQNHKHVSLSSSGFVLIRKIAAGGNKENKGSCLNVTKLRTL